MTPNNGWGKDARGGSRPGAGRKPYPVEDRLVAVWARIRRETKAAIDAEAQEHEKNASCVIRETLQDKFGPSAHEEETR